MFSYVNFFLFSRARSSIYSMFFPSFSFHFYSIFLLSSLCFICLESYFLPELSSFLFCFLVSFLCSLLCTSTFLVDYSSVRSDCPSVSFFFARLCGLLEAVGRRRPKVGLFIGRDYPFRFFLFFLFPLVHRSIGITQTMAMSREGEVRSSKLETGLSSSEDRRALEVTSPSTPHKAWGIHCALKVKDEKRIRDRFQFPSSVRIRILDSDDRACHYYVDELCFSEADFVSGLRFPIQPFIRELFFLLQLAPAQLVLNPWSIVVCCMVMWMSINDGDTIRIDEFLHFYRLRRSKDLGYWEFKPWGRSSRLVLDSPSSLQNWKTNFFFVSGDGWVYTPGEDPDNAPKLLHSWGTPVSGAS